MLHVGRNSRVALDDFQEVSDQMMVRVGSVMAISATLAALLMLTGCQGQPTKAKGDNTALMLIGYQADYLQANGRLPVAQDQVAPMIQATDAMVDAARNNGVGVFYIVDDSSPFTFVSNYYRNQATPRLWAGSQLDESADVFAGPTFTKQHRDAFANSALEPWLNQQYVGHLVLAGAYANRAVLASAKSALHLGYKVTVVSDAIADATAEARDHALQELKTAGANIETSQQVVAELKPNPKLGLIGPLTGAWWLLKGEKQPGSERYLKHPGELEPGQY
jgi:nicotinamidase-related amidase